MAATENNPKLKRVLSLPLLVLYGLGTTIGAGIYALIGELVAISGYFAPASFLVAAFIATLTAVSFAEMAGRIPSAAGTASYVKHGLTSIHLSTAVGLLVILAGLVSTSALINAFLGYLQVFIEVDRVITIIIIALSLGALAAWGIAESVMVASIITLIEVAGLLIIISVSYPGLVEFTDKWPMLIPTDLVSWGLIYAGAMLAFYTFIGFEDMVVVAEETKEVKRTLPLAIILTLAITTILYMCIVISAIFVMPPEQLASSSAPLAALYQHQTGESTLLITIIGMTSILNGALVQVIMASRVLYGLSSQGQIPAIFSQVNRKTHTPLFATAIAVLIAMSLALIGSLSSLAETTSLIMLIVFALVNLSLLIVKQKNPHPEGVLVFPIWVPTLGFLFSIGFVISEFIQLF